MPRISHQRMMEIMAVFQASFKRDNDKEVAAVPLRELREADEMLGDRDLNAGFRLALRNRIREIEASEEEVRRRRYESHIRAWNLVIGIVAGILIGVVTTWLAK